MNGNHTNENTTFRLKSPTGCRFCVYYLPHSANYTIKTFETAVSADTARKERAATRLQLHIYNAYLSAWAPGAHA